jgi:hypothetical protein
LLLLQPRSTVHEALTLFNLKFGPMVIVDWRLEQMERKQEAAEREGSAYTALTYAVRVNDIVLLKQLLHHGQGMT